MNRKCSIVAALAGILACVLLVGAVIADEPDLRPLLEKRVYQSADGHSLPYRLFVPRHYTPDKKYPLILFLHGIGERGDDNEAQLKHAGVLRFVSDAVQAKDPCFLVAPQCPKDDLWVPAFFGLKKIKERAQEETPGGPSRAMRLVTELLDKLEKDYSIDPERRYVTGLSMGGYGSYDLCLRRPDDFAAAVPICGAADPAAAAKIAHIPLWIFHGGSDSAVPVQLARDMVEALKKAGASPKYTEYPGVGHNSWTPAYQEPGLVDWLLSQRRGKR